MLVSVRRICVGHFDSCTDDSRISARVIGKLTLRARSADRFLLLSSITHEKKFLGVAIIATLWDSSFYIDSTLIRDVNIKVEGESNS